MRKTVPKKINILGVDVAIPGAERAAALTMEKLNDHARHTVCLLTAESSMLAQSQPENLEFFESCDLVLPGDAHIEQTVRERSGSDRLFSRSEEGSYAADYLRKLFWKLNKRHATVYVITEGEELFGFWEELSHKTPDLTLYKSAYVRETEGEAGRIVNEINAILPDVVFCCVPARQQIPFYRENYPMMNVPLFLCVEEMGPLADRMPVPAFFEKTHLSGLYRFFHGGRFFRKKALSSAFRRKIDEEHPGEDQ